MKWRTEIRFDPPAFRLNHRQKVFLIGSCFTDHMGAYLRSLWFDAMVNPFGTLFNPHSVRRLLERALGPEYLTETDLFRHESLWKSFELPGLFNRPTQAEFLRHANETLDRVREFLRQTDTAFVTYGTAQVWIHKALDRPVANCHKVPAREFERRTLTPEQIREDMEQTVHLLRTFNPSMHIVFTVSPVRYLQDGFTANTLSKARLLSVVIDQAQTDGVYYFPAYEIFMDDLRDYRFYAADLIHPGEQGIAYVREIFDRTFFDDATRALNRKIVKWRKRLLHRPLHPGENEQKNREKLRAEIEELLKNHPYLRPDVNY